MAAVATEAFRIVSVTGGEQSHYGGIVSRHCAQIVPPICRYCAPLPGTT